MTYPPLLLILPWPLETDPRDGRELARSRSGRNRTRERCRGPRTLGGFAGFREDLKRPESA